MRRPTLSRIPLARVLGGGVTGIVLLLLLVWFATAGNWRITDPFPYFSRYYDGLAASMSEGKLEVPREDISGEAFVVDGRIYGYFGPTPAWARMVLNGAFAGMRYRWSRISLVTSGVVLAAALVFLLHHLGVGAGAFWSNLYVFTAVAGSSFLFAVSWPAVYTEAIAWGASLAIGSYALLLRWSSGGRAIWFAGAAALAFLSFFARFPTGASALLALAVAALLRRNRSAMAIAAFTIVASASIYIAMNKARFGAYLDGMPIR